MIAAVVVFAVLFVAACAAILRSPAPTTDQPADAHAAHTATATTQTLTNL